jgi:hypothetical protein
MMFGKDKDKNKIPDVAEAILGFRVWRFDEDDYTLWSVTQGDYGKNKSDPKRKLLSAATGAIDLPDGFWPKSGTLDATCINKRDHPVPDPNCSCGIYSTYDINVIAQYIRQGPVLGLVQGYGQVINGLPDDDSIGGFRAEHAKIVCLFSIKEEFTISHRQLRKLGREYNVPVITPWSDLALDYAAAVRNGTLEELGKVGSL